MPRLNLDLYPGGESVVVDNDIYVRVLSVKKQGVHGVRVRIEFNAPADVAIDRESIRQRKIENGEY